MSTWMCQRLGGTSSSRAPNPTLPIQPLAFFVWLGTCGVWIRGDFIFARDSLHMLPHILLNERATVFHGNLAATLRVRSSFFRESQNVYSQLLVVYFSSVWGEASWDLAMLWSKSGFDYCVVMVKRAMCGEHVFLLKFLLLWHVCTQYFSTMIMTSLSHSVDYSNARVIIRSYAVQ